MDNLENHPGEEGREINIDTAHYQALLIEAQAEAAAEAVKRKPIERQKTFDARRQAAHKAEIDHPNLEAFEAHKRDALELEVYGRLQQLLNPEEKAKEVLRPVPLTDGTTREEIRTTHEIVFERKKIHTDTSDSNRVGLYAIPDPRYGQYGPNDRPLQPVLDIMQPPEGMGLSDIPLEEAHTPGAKHTTILLAQAELQYSETNVHRYGGGTKRQEFNLPLEERLELFRQYFPQLAEAAGVDPTYTGPTADSPNQDPAEVTRAKHLELGRLWGEGAVYA